MAGYFSWDVLIVFCFCMRKPRTAAFESLWTFNIEISFINHMLLTDKNVVDVWFHMRLCKYYDRKKVGNPAQCSKENSQRSTHQVSIHQSNICNLKMEFWDGTLKMISDSTHCLKELKKNRASDNEGKFHSFLMCWILIYSQKSIS